MDMVGLVNQSPFLAPVVLKQGRASYLELTAHTKRCQIRRCWTSDLSRDLRAQGMHSAGPGILHLMIDSGYSEPRESA